MCFFFVFCFILVYPSFGCVTIVNREMKSVSTIGFMNSYWRCRLECVGVLYDKDAN